VVSFVEVGGSCERDKGDGLMVRRVCVRVIQVDWLRVMSVWNVVVIKEQVDE